MKVAVVGAGLMGSGIAQVFLVAGHEVVLNDQSDVALEAAKSRIEDIYSLLQVDADLSRLALERDLAIAVEAADLVIEAIVEDLDIKRDLFQRISKHAHPDAIFATNTSSIPVGDIAQGLADPGRLVGAHFWNPPWAVALVEVIQGRETRPAVVSRIMQVLADLHMQPVHVKRDVPGCVGNRLQHALKREAIALVENGICDAETVDTVVKSGFGLRLPILGPLEQSDLVGLDLTLRIHETLISDLDRTPGPAPLLQQRVAEGNTGMKAGKGFRDWTTERAAEVRERLDNSLVAHGRARIAKLQCDSATIGGADK